MPPLVRLLPAVILALAPSQACTMVSALIQTGASFRVQVEDHGSPVNSLRVELTGSKYRAVSKTDKDGVAVFRNLSPGQYQMNTEHDTAYVQVVRGGPANVTVSLSVPNQRPIVVRALRGSLHGPDASETPILLDLLDAKSGRLFKSTQTSATGEFDFQEFPPGRYFLRLRHSDRIAVTVDPAASTEQLEIDFGSSSCGLWYLDRHQCPQTDLPLGQLSSSVVDPMGAAISSATILLLDSSNKLLEQLQPDRDGKFTAAHSLSDGDHLAVTAPGFSPLHATAKTDQHPHFLTINLGIGGSCSTFDRH